MFHNARLKLTLWYLAIIMAISITFSLVIYRFLSIEIERFEKAQRYRIERFDSFRRFTLHIEPSSELIKEAKERILITLIMVNGSIFFLSGVLGYLLADRTLKPNGNDLFEKLSLKQIILDSVKKIEPLANKKDIILKTNLVDTEIKGNKFSLIDLFVIILDNSIKYSSPKSKISITAYKKDSAIVVSVKDQGIGISAKDLPHIFDRFYRSDSARSHDKTKGYGLGLSIAQKIVKLHKGSIIAESIPKKGTTITDPLCNLTIFWAIDK